MPLMLLNHSLWNLYPIIQLKTLALSGFFQVVPSHWVFNNVHSCRALWSLVCEALLRWAALSWQNIVSKIPFEFLQSQSFQPAIYPSIVHLTCRLGVKELKLVWIRLNRTEWETLKYELSSNKDKTLQKRLKIYCGFTCSIWFYQARGYGNTYSKQAKSAFQFHGIQGVW